VPLFGALLWLSFGGTHSECSLLKEDWNLIFFPLWEDLPWGVFLPVQWLSYLQEFCIWLSRTSSFVKQLPADQTVQHISQEFHLFFKTNWILMEE